MEADSGLERLGFRGAGDAAGATIAQGFQVFTVPPGPLLDDQQRALEAIVAPSTQWLFLVTVAGSPRALLTVDLVAGEWKAVSIGGASLSGEIDGLLARWPATAYQHRFIRSYQGAAEVMEVARGATVLGAVPLASARVSLGGSGRFDAGDVFLRRARGSEVENGGEGGQRGCAGEDGRKGNSRRARSGTHRHDPQRSRPKARLTRGRSRDATRVIGPAGAPRALSTRGSWTRRTIPGRTRYG